MNMQKNGKQDRLYWDIVKGLGIFSIVAGHCSGAFPFIIRFVYLYHLALFFFVSGFLYSEKKYGDDPKRNLGARMSSWPRYVFYMALYALLHNTFLRAGIILGAKEYSLSDLIVALTGTITFTASETMGGALWFVPVLVVASGIFGCIIYAGRIAQRFTGRLWCKYAVVGLLTACVGLLGIYTNLYGLYFVWHIQTSLVVVPLFTAAWLIRTHLKDISVCLHWIPGCIALACLMMGMKYWGWKIVLADNEICGRMFYPISLLGVYFCLTLAKYFQRIPFLNRLVAFCGRYSFDIMAGHFLAFKLVDIVYARMIGETDANVFGVFPVAYSRALWLVYIAVGLLLPAAAAHVWSLISQRLARRIDAAGAIDA